MRLLLKLKPNGKYSYNTSINHKIQGFIYDCLKEGFFRDLHSKEGPKYFSFSNLFPIGELSEDKEVNLIISSPIEQLIETIRLKIESREVINIGEYSFKLSGFKVFKLKLKDRLNIITATPVILRIPKIKYKEYNIDSKRPYEYWRSKMPINLFIDMIENNLIKKYNEFYGLNLNRVKLFNIYEFKKEVSVVLEIKGKNVILVGSLWKFTTEPITKDNESIFRFMIDSGIGEMNSLGFGFLNIQK